MTGRQIQNKNSIEIEEPTYYKYDYKTKPNNNVGRKSAPKIYPQIIRIKKTVYARNWKEVKDSSGYVNFMSKSPSCQNPKAAEFRVNNKESTSRSDINAKSSQFTGQRKMVEEFDVEGFTLFLSAYRNISFIPLKQMF